MIPELRFGVDREACDCDVSAAEHSRPLEMHLWHFVGHFLRGGWHFQAFAVSQSRGKSQDKFNPRVAAHLLFRLAALPAFGIIQSPTFLVGTIVFLNIL